MSDDALVTLAEDAQGWLGGSLALPVFVDVVRSIAGEERYRELVRWASRRGPKLSEEKRAELEQLADMLRELVREVGVRRGLRSVAAR
jgi:hypothetical protein